MNNTDTALRVHVQWLIGGLFGLSLAAFLILHATQPIIDSDFWWHLKTGEMVVEQQGLLYKDPFTFQTGSDQSPREALILKSYWLWEVTAYGFYSLLGFKGIFLLNLLTAGAMMVTLIWQMYRNAIPTVLAAPLLTLGFILFRVYPLERPQVMSFLFAAILLGLLLRVRQGKNLGWTLPITMCLWANLHGGFVVGDIMLGCFAVGAMIEYRYDHVRLKQLLGWILVGLGASLLNPTGWLAIGEVFRFIGTPLQTGIVEYKSTWTGFSEGSKYVSILWLLVCLYGLGVCLSRRCYWPELLVATFLAFFSIRYMRNVAFFSLAMLPATGLAWKETFQHRHWHFPAATGVIAAGLSAVLLLWMATGQWKQRRPEVLVAPIYPEAAIEFLQNNGLQGRLFNSYEYGGYLLWRLAPKIKIFIDGRGINETVFDHYKKITLASLVKINGKHEYEKLLDYYQIDLVIQPIYDGYGNIQPLMKALIDKDEWMPIYLDTQVYVLAKATDQNLAFISSLIIKKEEFKTRLLLIYNYLQATYPQEIGFKIARAGMLIYLGQYQDAKSEIDAIATEAPNEKMLPSLQRELHLLAGRMNR